MSWNAQFLPEAQKDLAKLDKSKQIIVKKAVLKVAQNPLPDSEGGYGKPLKNNNEARLSGLMKIKLRGEGLRIVYKLVRQDERFVIIIIGVRDDSKVYKEAEKRRDKYGL